MSELPENEVLLLRYGDLLWSAVSAFGQDPSYLVDMAEAANLIEYKRNLWQAKSEALRQAKEPDQVKELTGTIMRERGIYPPQGRRRRAAVA